MSTRSLLLASTLLLGACGRGPAAAFEAGVPSEKTVKLEVPETATQGLTLAGDVQPLKLNEESVLYKLTYGVTTFVNVGTGAVLRLVRDITRHPPTTLTENQAVWGPHTEALAQNTWKLTVTRLEAGKHEYTLEGRDKTKPDSPFVTVLSGTHTQAMGANGQPLEDFGKGTFTIDWDARATLPQHNPKEMGQGVFTYSRMSPDVRSTVDVRFMQVRDAESGERMDAEYRYASVTEAEPGQFDFAILKNFDTRAQLERMSIRSRWHKSGAGRADVRFSGGDMGTATAELNECWDSAFLSKYAQVTSTTQTTWQVGYGTEATDCAIQGASYFEEEP